MYAPLLIIFGLGTAAWCAVTSDWSRLGFGSGWETGLAPNSGLWLVGVILPGLGLLVFGLGLLARLAGWLRAPLRENTCLAEGQRRSLSWVKPDRLAAPVTPAAARLRRWHEIVSFYSLRRDSRLQLDPQNGEALQYPSTWLRLAALLFHYSLLLVLLRHLGLWLEPVPGPLNWLNSLDGFFLLDGRPLYISDLILPFSLLLLLGRRFFYAPLRRLSLAADYFALYLLLGISGSGLALRAGELNAEAAKSFCRGLIGLDPVFPAGLPPLFYLHLFFCSLLLFYFPFSKFMHVGGVALAPTRSLPLLPFNCLAGREGAKKRRKKARFSEAPGSFPPPACTYAEYSAAFRTRLLEAGLEKTAGPVPASGAPGNSSSFPASGSSGAPGTPGTLAASEGAGDPGLFAASPAPVAPAASGQPAEALTRPGGWALE